MQSNEEELSEESGGMDEDPYPGAGKYARKKEEKTFRP